jgi:predicted  nucleic acid-binding Zn-ribbon protein
MKRLVVIFSGLFFLIACSDFKQKEQLKAVEQLTSEATTLSKDFQASFPDTLSTMRQNMMQLQLFLQQHVVLDSVDRMYAKDMDTYKLARKKIGPINKQYVALKQAFAQENTRLAQLHSDISNGFGKRDRYDAYIATEKKNITLLESRLNELKKELNALMDTYRLLHPKLNSLAGKYK